MGGSVMITGGNIPLGSPSPRKLLLPLLISILFTLRLYAQWSTDPNNNLIVGYGLPNNLCSDGAGGAYVVYNDSPILVRRLDRYGYQPWGSNRQIHGIYPESRDPLAVSDGRGGIIVGFLDWYEPVPNFFYPRVRAQRLDSSGNFLWGSAGVRVGLVDTIQGIAAIGADGAGGCVILFGDALDPQYDSVAIRVQRLDSLGRRMWGDSGIMLEHRWTGIYFGPYFFERVARDRFLLEYGSTMRMLTGNGTPLWSTNFLFTLAAMEKDIDQSVILAGIAGTYPNRFVVAQKLDYSGQLQWQLPYVIVSDTGNIVFNSELRASGIYLDRDLGDGTTFAWTKEIAPTQRRSFTQRFTSNGSVIFQSGGINIAGSDSASTSIAAMVASREGTKIYITTVTRSTTSTIARRLDSLGSNLWPDTGVLVSTRIQGDARGTTDGSGGCIVTGFGGESDFSIRAQQVSTNGRLGEIVTSVRVQEPPAFPRTIMLHQNWPNPFNNSTEISFSLNSSQHIELSVYNLLGQKVRTLVHGFVDAGEHRLHFDAGNLAAGIYLLQLVASSDKQSTKVLLLK